MTQNASPTTPETAAQTFRDHPVTGRMLIGGAISTAKRVQSGFVWINGVNAHVRAVSFGGYKNSGVGRERGIDELISYTDEKSIQIFLQ